MAKFEWQGFDSVEANLKKVPQIVGNALRSAANAGATVLKDEVIARAPEFKGVLKSAIYQKHIDELSSSDRQVYIVSWRKGKSDVDAFYAAWVEYGHWYVPPKLAGVSTKAHRAANRKIWVEKHPFLRPAFSAKRDAALSAMRVKLAANVRAAIAEIYK
ncbi:HK97 gp10 family phage protein [Collimonas sp. NPDC087041]|uniref:HK97 gp10 family phage protein n=1 Tax=Collimonas sp. NPDC087041 TaxID=3363960 RepID=UPI003815E716